MWGSAMSFYFQNYVDQHALYEFIEKLGLVASPGDEGGVGTAILGAFQSYCPQRC